MTKKQTLISIISILLMMISLVLYALSVNYVSLAALSSKYIMNDSSLTTNDIIMIHDVMRDGILFDLIIFSLIQFVSYILYIFKKKKALYAVAIVELLLVISAMTNLITYHLASQVIFALPIINISLYLIGLMDKNKGKSKKKEKK